MAVEPRPRSLYRSSRLSLVGAGDLAGKVLAHISLLPVLLVFGTLFVLAARRDLLVVRHRRRRQRAGRV